MKISNNIDITSPLIQQIDTKNQKETVQGVKYTAEQPVKLSISDEGWAHYRSSVQQSGQESYDAVLQRKEQSKKISVISYGYEITSRAQKWNEDAADNGKKFLSVTDRADGYLKAYAQLYDEIVQGYNDGTREIYVEDEYGMHKLTKDEELSALNAAYARTVDDFVLMEETNQQAREIISEGMKKIARISSRGTMAMDYQDEQNELNQVPKNLRERMMSAANLFKKKYALYNPVTDNFSQLLMSVKV